MSISTAIQNLKQKISNAYDKIEEANGTLPAVKNADNLALAIESIPEGYELEDGITLEPKIWHVIFMSENNEVARYTIDEFKDVTSLPAIPDVEDCIADGWNWTIDKIKTYINTQTITSDIVVGAQYKSADGTTILYCSIPKGGRHQMSLYLQTSVASGLQIDWGDGNTENSTSTTAKAYVHEYSLFGDYKIKLTCKSGTLQFGGNSSTYNIFGNRTNSATNPNSAYARTVNKIIIGNGVTTIFGYAFQYCYSLQSITIPSSVKTIGTYAFQYCYSLQSITIPSSVTSIGTYAFNYCSSLQNITIPSSVKTIGTYAFNYCQSLQNITIPSSVTSIGSNAFQNCYSLQNITIPSSVTSIGTQGFYNCYSLQNITIPNSVTSIDANAFYNCHSLQSKLLNKQLNNLICCTLQTNNYSKYLDYKTNINKIIAVDLKTIKNAAFYSCYSLQNITIPSSMTTLGGYTFNSCYSLQNITIPNSVTSIGHYAFQNCYSLQNITIPSSMTTFGNSVFAGCTSLQSISIPNSVTTLGAYTFNSCYSLQNIIIPSSVTSIGTQGFYNCYSLQNITIPNSVTSIGTQGFYNCYSLQNITIPNSVTSINANAFYNCHSIQYVKWDSSASIPSSCFSGCYGVRYYDFSDATKVIALGATSYIQVNNDTEIIVPDNLYDSWKAAANWSNSAIVTHIVKKSQSSLYANNIENSVVTNFSQYYPKTGMVIQPIPTLTLNGIELHEGVDYTISYSNSNPIDVGQYTITMTGINSYDGILTLTYSIIQAGSMSQSRYEITATPNRIEFDAYATDRYITKSNFKIDVYDTENSFVLVEDEDYIVEFPQVKQPEPGDSVTAYATIKGINPYSGETKVPIYISTDGDAMCLLKGTMITLSDGSEKPIEDITYDDELLVWNFDEGKIDKAKPAWIKVAQTGDYWFENVLDDGKTLYTTGKSSSGWGHRMFDVDKQKFVYTTESVSDNIKTLDDVARHMKCIRHDEKCEYYNVITAKHFNLFANGILTSCSLNNLYRIEDMKFVEQTRNTQNFDVNCRFVDDLRLNEQPLPKESIVEYTENLKNTMKRG